MAPRETPKPTTKLQRNLKDGPAKGKASPVGAMKKPTLVKRTVEKTPLKTKNTSDTRITRQRTSTAPVAATPKPKENKPAAAPSSVTKSVKKHSWKRIPRGCHTGVPIPEKMRLLMEKQFADPEFVL